MFVSGYSTAPALCPSVSSVGLETQIRRPWLAKIRLGTYSTQYGNTPYYTPTQAYPYRLAKYTVPVRACPSSLGFAAVQYPGAEPQIKIIPSIRLMQGVIDRLEAIGTNIPTFLTILGADDVKMWAYSIVKRRLKTYAGATAGSLMLEGATRTEAEPTHIHVGDNSMDQLRLPENIANYVGALSAYNDNNGLLIPQMAFSDLTTLTTSLTYSGTPTFVIPAAQLATQRGVASLALLAVKIKGLEQLMARFINERFQTEYGPSFLDTTFLYDSTSANCLGIVSRRPLSAKLLAGAKVNFSAISYIRSDMTQASSAGRTYFNHVFRQANRKDFSGYDLVSTLAGIGAIDGIVNGALTSNMSGSDGPDTIPNERLVGEGVPGHDAKFSHAESGSPYYASIQDIATKRLGLTHGNYGGKGYSAGQFGGSPAIKDGKYVLPPVDEEDAAYKRHDEAYINAKPAAKALADQRLVLELKALPALSPLGHAAKYYFDSKWWHVSREE